MNVQPTLFTHPKFQLYKRALGSALAFECLARLWAHCQTMQRGENWGNVTPDYVEAIADWPGDPGKLFEALTKEFCGKPGWVRVSPEQDVIIVNWEEHNLSLLRSWRVGPMGGRPKKQPPANPKETPRLTQGLPPANPKVTLSEPPENPIGLDRMGMDGSGSTERARTGADFPEVEIPSLQEVLDFCQGPAGIPAATGRKFFDHYEKTALPAWTSGGKRFQWRGRLTSWAADDRVTGGKNGESKTRAQLEAELETETDPGKRRALREQIKKLPA